MSQLAIKGQENKITIMRSGLLEDELTEIDMFEATFVFELLERRNLGETTVRTDEIFAGIKGKTKLRLFSQSFTLYVQAIEQRARRQQPTIVFNFISTLLFPNGDTPVISFPDVNFGNMPLNSPSGKDYVTLDLDWACGEFDIET